jgi:hypothetical protein
MGIRVEPMTGGLWDFCGGASREEAAASRAGVCLERPVCRILDDNGRGWWWMSCGNEQHLARAIKRHDEGEALIGRLAARREGRPRQAARRTGPS